MGAYVSPGGIIIPDGNSMTADFAAVLKGMMDGTRGGKGLNQQTIPTFATLNALKAAFPSGSDEATVPPYARVLGDNVYQWVPAPFKVWSPQAGTEISMFVAGRTDVQPRVQTVGQVYGITPLLTLPTLEWPHWIEVRFRTLVYFEVDTERVDIYVNVNGSADGKELVQGDGSHLVSFGVWNAGTSQGSPPTPATTLIGGITKRTGTNDVVVEAADPVYTKLDAVITPCSKPPVQA